MADPLVLYEVDDKVGIITLNRPDKLNAISAELQQALTETFARADADPATSVVLLRADGRSFCAGYDIGAKGPDADDWRGDPTKAHAHLRPQLEFEMAPWLMNKPVIASVQGHVLGGGCELVMLCDLTIAADNATFGEPEVRFSAVGPAIVMPMIIGYKKARELLYFGDRIDAQTALELGMINRIVPLPELRQASLDYARRLSMISPEALFATKRAVNRVADATGFRTALYAALDVVGPLYATTTELGARFREIARTEGVPAAVRWRSAQFEPGPGVAPT
jgi:enoyl-CoA hydratase